MLGAGSILAGAFIGAGIGALSTTAMKEGEEISTGNVRSAGERLAYAVFDDSMSWDEKWAYAFDPGQMVADFVTGVVIGEILDGIMAAIQNKLRSIFANYDAAMREAFESGTEADLFLPDEFYNKNLPNQVAPGTKYLPKYDELGNVKHIKMYDDCGREIGWGDYTNHGYGDINSPHYHTTPHWHEKIYNAQYPDGIKINHRTDVNTPLGDIYEDCNNNIQFIKEMFLKIGLMVKEELMWNISNFDSVPVNSEDYSGVGRTVNDSRQRVYLFQQRILNEHTVVIGHKELLNLFGDIRTIYEAVFVATIDGCQSEISIFDGDIISIQGNIEDFL